MLALGCVQLARTSTWRTGLATSYATWEGLTNGDRTACGPVLRDDRRTLAVQPGALRCGTRVRVCAARCATGTVTDTTASSYTFELSYALALAIGMPDIYRGREVKWSSRVRWRAA